MSDQETVEVKTPPYFCVGSYPVGIKTLAGLFAVFLGALEWIRLYILDVPVHAAMNGFNTAAALVANIGFGAVAVGTVFVLALFVAATGVALNLMYFFLLRGVARTTSISRFLISTFRHVSIAAFVFKPSGSVVEPTKIQVWARSVWQAFETDRQIAETKRVAFVQKALARFEKVNETFRGFRDRLVELFWFVDRSEKPQRDARLRFGAAVLFVLFAALISALGYKIHHAEMGRASQEFAADLKHYTEERKWWPMWIEDQPELVYPPKSEFFPLRVESFVGWIPRALRRVSIPRTQIGTLLVSKSENVASHLEPKLGSDGDTFRTEPVFYIGDFGEWAYVAPVLDFEAGMLIRRSSILEFSFDGAGTPIRDTEPPVIEDGSDGTTFVDVGGVSFHRDGFSAADAAALKQSVLAEVEQSLKRELEVKDEKLSLALEALTADFSKQQTANAGRWSQAGSFDLEYAKFASGLAVQFADTTERVGALEELSTRLDQVTADLAELAAFAGPDGLHFADTAGLTAQVQRAGFVRGVLRDDLDDLEAGVSGFEGRFAGLDVQVRDQAMAQNVMGQRLDMLGKSVRDLAHDVADLQGDDSAVRAELANVRDTLGQLRTRGATLFSELEQSLGRDRIAALKARETLRLEAEAIKVRLDEFQDSLLDNVQRVETRSLTNAREVERVGFETDTLRAALSEHAQHGTGGGVTRFPPDMYSLIEDGVATRPSGLLSDLIRQGHLSEIKKCQDLKLGHGENAPIYIDFDEGAVRRGDQVGLSDLIQVLKAQGDAGALVILQGGASYTGQPASNLRLSEARAEWVKRTVLRKLLDQPRAHPTDLDQTARATLNLHLVAYGVGESLPSPGKYSARAVKAFVCPLPSSLRAQQDIAQN